MMTATKKAKRREEIEKRLATKAMIEALILERDTAHLRSRGTANFSLYGDGVSSGPIKARRRRQTSAPRFPRNRAEDTILNW